MPRDQTSLVIVGHGTNLNDNSTKAIQDQVALIRDGGYGFAQVIDTYMEEAPFVADWAKLTTAPHVVVVPFSSRTACTAIRTSPCCSACGRKPVPR